MNQYREAAERLIARLKRPLKAKEIVDRAINDRIFSDKIYGKTPYKTMNARLSEEIVRNGDQSTFVRTAPGTFYLRRLLSSTEAKSFEDNLKASSPLQVYKARRRMPARPRERVLAIPVDVLRSKFRFQGYKAITPQQLQRLMLRPRIEFLDRISAELTEEFKQVVVYVLVRRANQLLSFRRGTFNRTPAFLRGSLCVGFGGHVNEEDHTIFSQDDFGILAGIERELREEIGLQISSRDDPALRLLGIINDDSSAEGRRHIGIVYDYTASSAFRPSKGEKSINQLKWIDVQKGYVDLNQFEYWSQLCLAALFPNFSKAQPDYKIVKPQRLTSDHVLVVVGTAGSGKSAATKLLAEHYGYKVINSGRLVASILGIPPVPETSRSEFQKAAWRFISEADGPLRLAAAIKEAIGQQQDGPIAIDGIRQLATLEALRGLVAPRRLFIIYVQTTPDTAVKLLRKREGDIRPVEASAAEIYGADVEDEVKYMISSADAIIYNWLGTEDYEDAVTKMMQALASG